MNSIPYSDYVIFVDESGDHSLESIDPEYPVFVLDFCIFRKEHYTTAVVPRVQEFKFRHFGHDLVVLHEHDIRRQKPPFVFLKSQGKREAFMEELTRLVDNAEFTIVASVIDKKRHVESNPRASRRPGTAPNPTSRSNELARLSTEKPFTDSPAHTQPRTPPRT